MSLSGLAQTSAWPLRMQAVIVVAAAMVAGAGLFVGMGSAE